MMQLMQVLSSPFDKSATYWRPCILVLHLVDIFVSAMAHVVLAAMRELQTSLCQWIIFAAPCSRHVCWIAAASNNQESSPQHEALRPYLGHARPIQDPAVMRATQKPMIYNTSWYRPSEYLSRLHINLSLGEFPG